MTIHNFEGTRPTPEVMGRFIGKFKTTITPPNVPDTLTPELEELRRRQIQALGIPADLLEMPEKLKPSVENFLKKQIQEGQERTNALLKRVQQLEYDTRHRRTRGRFVHRHKGRAQRGHHHPFQ